MTTEQREPADRDQLDPDELRFIERFALLLTEGGVPRMPARVFGCVLVDDEGRMTAVELARTLGVSPAAISGAVRYLVQIGLLVKGREPGSRRDHYRLGDDVWYEAFTERDRLLQRWQEAASEGVALYGPDRPAGRRLRETEAFMAFLREESPKLGERWRAHKRAIGLDDAG